MKKRWSVSIPHAAVRQLPRRRLDGAERLRGHEGLADVGVLRAIGEALESEIVEHVREVALGEAPANRFAHPRVVVVESQHDVGGELVEVAVEVGNLLWRLPPPAVALEESVAAGWVDDLVVDRESQRQEAVRLHEATGAEPALTDGG